MKKTILLSEFLDEKLFSESFERYFVFDKESLGLTNGRDKISNHFNNIKIKDSLNKALKNNDNIVYLVYTSNPDLIIHNIIQEFSDYKLSFYLITEDPEGYNKDLYEKIIVK